MGVLSIIPFRSQFQPGPVFQPGQLIADLLIDSLRTDTNPFDQLPREKLLN